MARVDSSMEGPVAVVTPANPPVNALSHAVREGLDQALKRARGDPQVKAIVLMGAGRLFSGGADITEFGKPPKSPSLREVIASIESSEKPVVAAIHGTAF